MKLGVEDGMQLKVSSIGFAQTPTSDAYASTIESEDLRQLLYVYASDFFQGRETGTLGQKRAVTFLKEFYESRGIQAAAGSEDYFQKMTLNPAMLWAPTDTLVAACRASSIWNLLQASLSIAVMLCVPFQTETFCRS